MSSTRRNRRFRSPFPHEVEFQGLQAAPAFGGEGWSLLHSVRRALLIFVALWQAVMLYATFATLEGEAVGLAAVELLLGAAALAALRFRWLTPVLPAGMAAVGLWAYVVSGDVDSTLAVAATWQNNFSMLLAGALLIGPLGIVASVAITAALGAAIAWLVPVWGPPIAVSTVIALLSILAAMRFGLARLFGVATAADAAAERTADAQRRARLAGRVSAQMAEESRVLHDTAINTLGAVANGGAGTADAEKVRIQCGRDVSLLESLRDDPSRMASSSLAAIFEQPGLPTVP